MQGWIKLHRQIMENEFWLSERFTKAQAWIDLTMLANYKPNTIFIRGNEVKTERGELCYSMVSLAKRWSWNERTVDKFLKLLENRQMIQSRRTALTTIITIINYSHYQSDTEQTTEQTQSRIQTNKKDKKDKNNTESIIPENVYRYYAEKVKAGGKSDAVKSVSKLLKEGNTEDELLRCIDNYALTMPKDNQFRIQANNFFGRAERYKEFINVGQQKSISTLPILEAGLPEWMTR